MDTANDTHQRCVTSPTLARTYLAMDSEGGGRGGREQALEHLQLYPLICGAITAAHHGNGVGLRGVEAELSRAHVVAACR